MRTVYFATTLLFALLCALAQAQGPVDVAETVSPEQLAISPDDLATRTIGRISDEARERYKTFDEYVAARRRDSIAGKGFEAFYAIDYNATSRDGTAVLPTAALGRPTDPADLVLVRKETGEILALFQCKIGATAAVKAAADPKYANFDIVVPSDTYLAIGRNPAPSILPLLESGRIVCEVMGRVTKTRAQYEERSLEHLRKEYDDGR